MTNTVFRNQWPVVLLACLVTVASLTSAAPCRAESQDQEFEEEPLKLPLGAIMPPDISKGGRGLEIGSTNAPEYRLLLIPELYPLVRSGTFVLEAARRLKYNWAFDQEWLKNSNELKLKSLGSDGRMPEGFKPFRGFPFGTVEHLAQEKDPGMLATKVLWNIYAHAWSQRILEGEIELVWFKDNKVTRSARAALDRIYPATLPGNAPPGQLFRELIRFQSPSVIEGLAWLSFRFFGADEDSVWTYSIANRRVVQLTGSNRSDPLITSSVSADDFFVWSGKPESVEATVDKSVVALVPFPNLSQDETSSSRKGCTTIGSNPLGFSARNPSKWNVDSRRYPQGAAWLPSTTVFVPRNLWRLELASKDPYALYGRQILYVDQQSMLPIYKIVYDRSGKQLKSVIGAFGLAVEKQENRLIPYNSYIIADNRAKDETSIVDFLNLTYCSEPSEELSLASFDPRKLAREQSTPAVERKKDERARQ